MDYLQYYHLEHYLFDVVSPRYKQEKAITAFDFFCIVIWKANRAKSKIAKRLLAHGNDYTSLDDAVGDLLAEISNAHDHRERLSVLVEGWGFLLPMASAILTVLYPEDFTVYDVRVCEVLRDFRGLENKRANFDKLWDRYTAYISAVIKTVPEYASLRNKDRFIWGQSFAEQLEKDISRSFDKKPKS